EMQQDVVEAARVADSARTHGGFTARFFGMERVLGPRFTTPMLDSIVKARGGTGTPTGADSGTLRTNVQTIIDGMFNANRRRTGPNQCHDITVYPAIGLAGGACGGYGLLLDIRDPAHPVRIGAVADSNFSYWHSATFNNDGTKVLFTDEWGGGGQPKCRDYDNPQWGADALFTLADGRMTFQSYSKMLAPGGWISRNEIEAAKLVRLDYFNTQDQPKLTWPATFVVARAYVDQLERSNGLSAERLKAVRQELARAEKSQGQARRDALTQLSSALGQDASGSSDQWKVQKLAGVVTELANTAVTGAQ